jgi:hypothetical protein
MFRTDDQWTDEAPQDCRVDANGSLREVLSCLCNNGGRLAFEIRACAPDSDMHSRSQTFGISTESPDN